jgi:hypothetical protein
MRIVCPPGGRRTDDTSVAGLACPERRGSRPQPAARHRVDALRCHRTAHNGAVQAASQHKLLGGLLAPHAAAGHACEREGNGTGSLAPRIHLLLLSLLAFTRWPHDCGCHWIALSVVPEPIAQRRTRIGAQEVPFSADVQLPSDPLGLPAGSVFAPPDTSVDHIRH